MRLLFIALVTLLAVQANAAEAIRQESPVGIRHSFLVTGATTTWIFDEDSNVTWQVDGYSRDGYVLENGNILISDGKSAREYNAGTTEVIWTYTKSEENDELGTVFRLENGDTMMVEQGINPRIIEIAPDGSLRREVKLQPETDNAHMQTRMARKLPSGNYLVPHLLAFKVKEYTPAGEVVRAIATDLPQFGGREIHNWPFTAITLPNGNIHVNLTHGHKTAEFDAEGNLVWWADNTVVEGEPFADPCGAQRLPNGNTVIGAYGQRDPEKIKIFEITRDKEIVWTFYHPEVHAHEIHVLTTNGEKVSPVYR